MPWPVSRYLTPFTQPGLAMEGQPLPQLYFHRPLGILLGSAFEAGLVLEALEERAFPPCLFHPPGSHAIYRRYNRCAEDILS